MKSTSINCSHIALSKTIALATKAKELLEQKKDIVNLTAGEPDFSSPPNVRDYIKNNIDNFRIAYTNVQGILELRKEISYKLLTDNELVYSPDQILVSNGAKHSLFNAFLYILNPGDEVIIFSPYWVSYVEMVKLLNAVPVIVETKFENSFLPTKESIESKITDKTKIILLNSPNNPTGVLYPENTHPFQSCLKDLL
jgi:aspartate aminotransferase